MKIHDFRVEVLIKSEGFKALRFSKLLVEEKENESRLCFESLLEDYEKGQFYSKMSRQEDKPKIYLDLDKFEFNIFFDRACSRKEMLGSYAFKVLDRDGKEIYLEAKPIITADKVTNNIAKGYRALKVIEYLQS